MDDELKRRTAEQSPATLDFYVQRRSGKKRNYIFDFGKSRKCSHPCLREMVVGSNFYRCEECNYAFFINSATQWPLHFLPIMGAFQIMHFAKEFGIDSLQEVLRRPIGQPDGTPQKPVLPEGMSFTDVLAALENVNINSEDQGRGDLRALLSELWESHQHQLPLGQERESDNGNGEGP